MDCTPGFYALAKARGREVVPYLLKHMDAIWSYYGRGQKHQGQLLEHARANGWWDLWGLLVRKGDNEQYNKEVLALVQNRSEAEEVLFRRLILLSGASSEWNWGRFAWQQVQHLNDATAVALYRRFPDLVHGPFRRHVVINWWGADALPTLTAAVLAKDDHELIDHLASQAILLGRWGFHGAKKTEEKGFEKLLDYYQRLTGEPAVFARRVASVLGKVPAYTIGSAYKNILENNALARLFFVQSASALLHDPRSIRDLLEASEIQTQMLALRVLAQEDERASRLAADNLDVLQATLLRPMHRRSHILALTVLANAAVSSEHARTILARCRQALDLPEKGYPREHLIALIAGLNHRWPDLCAPGDRPTVYQSQKQRSRWAPR
jgi:hypothetical protein